MCCTTGRHQNMDYFRNVNSCACGCHGPLGNGPRFMTKDQMIGKLNEHLETLQNEVIAVKERIDDLKKKR